MDTSKIIIPYAKPSCLSDPYREYDKTELLTILATPEENLCSRQLSMLFHGGLCAGYYEECCYYLPYILQYVADEKANCNEVLYYLIYWGRFWYSHLVKDDIWPELNNYLDELFCSFSKDFIIDRNMLHPNKWEYINTFLFWANNIKYEDYELAKLNNTQIPPIPYQADGYLATRFSSPESYSDWAWLIFLINEKNNHSFKSPYLSLWEKRNDWHSTASQAIIAHCLNYPEDEDFWTTQLNGVMIY